MAEETGKNDLQEQKGATADEILTNKTAQPEEEPQKKKRGRPKGSTTKKKPGRPSKAKTAGESDMFEFDQEAAAGEGKFLVEMVVMLREQIGVKKPLPPIANMMFRQSYIEMARRHGAAAARYMPYLMFGGSTLLILYDTTAELKKIKQAEKELAEKDKPKDPAPKNQQPKAGGIETADSVVKL